MAEPSLSSLKISVVTDPREWAENPLSCGILIVYDIMQLKKIFVGTRVQSAIVVQQVLLYEVGCLKNICLEHCVSKFS